MNTASLHETYQVTPYPSRPVPLSHPDHLYVVGRLHGLTPAKIAGARVLELGCAAGGNLLPMAASLPEGEFIGIDLSERQIEMAQAGAAAGGLDNVEFLAGDALSLLAGGLGRPFDYIVLHGLYSWVPVEVQAALLPLCRRLLSEHGIIYISYNTYPGWHGRGLVRELMLRAGAAAANGAEQVAMARAALDDLIAAYAQNGDAYAALLAEEKARVDDMEDSFLLHDLLEVENHPIYLDQFLARADAAGLQFISEGNVAASREENFSPEARRQLAAIADPVVREQRIDFLLNRSFRQTLLCPKSAAVQRRIAPEWLAGLYLASPVRPLGPDANGASGEAFFATPDGGRFGMTAPSAIAALNHLALAWPDFLAIEELAAKIGDGAIVAQLAIDLYPRNWIDLLPRSAMYTTTPGTHPKATALARWQTQQGDFVTDLRHRSVTITDSFTRQLLPLLDGETDRGALLASVAGFDDREHSQVANDDPETLLDAALHQLAERCLLVQ
ncbi:MAG: methyltransferase domain-containing protein [Rhodospirillaceae bacterium]|jgi:SAM-dependent methyltransferase|nr:methyltransferase domain-containing protein [Rhodospirillaceae bacterium]MBT3492389.1 methyltransferase domain-containing protein [Rhodospirillaceae bacterium]MBT3780043.1 methyltransferase domain-containing protein [Rhodospirillaceae bacterium]MBT3978709.1 methyltransferase domain-containing protein [Rhodospirillaceae bacterium]MBT4168481.1 methyltransferase domain-containing protein [Rhodospirillaceae bacterium]